MSADTLTFQDLLDYLTDWQSANPQAHVQRFSRLAARTALDRLAHAHDWQYLYQHGRSATSAPYDTGTIAFDYTGGANERQVTLTDGSWPDWAMDGVLRISDVNYTVASRVSSSILQLDVQSNPGEDVASGTTYTLYRDAYVLPVDLWKIDELYCQEIGHHIGYEHPRDWLVRTRYNNHASNYPSAYTLMGSENYQGAMDLKLAPYPDSKFTLDYIYNRRPRPVVYELNTDGFVTNTANSATVTGTDTEFESGMVGSIIRFAVNQNEEPTGRWGANPFTEERAIIDVDSATSLTVDSAIVNAHTSVRFAISDPIDIDVPVMREALLRCCEAQLGFLRRLEDRNALDAAWEKALIKAKEADSRSTAPRAVGVSALTRRRLRDMPGPGQVDDED